jgi:DNA topoisomerase-1
MRVAQGLYENGYITYMRTDAVTLSAEALAAVRAQVTADYGASFLSPQPRQYSSKVKNAQEAHEAIRPTTPLRSPQQLQGELNSQELALYRLIWQRTLASQMADATGVTVSVRLGATSSSVNDFGGRDAEFAASGTTITFPGYRQVYVEGRDEGDDPTAAAERSAENEALLPQLTPGDNVAVESLEPQGHSTTPPPRYTEASLVKRLEELGIGRPSTWASIIQTIQDRGYVWKKGQALVPTWTAFAVVGLLEQHFDSLVDYEFTAKVETDLDAIAAGDRKKDEWLGEFYFGSRGSDGLSPSLDDDALPGLKRLVEENLDNIDAAAINTFPLGVDADGNEVVVKPGRFGPYVKRGDDTAGVPDDMAPDELTIDVALALLAAPKSDEPIGELDGLPVFAKNGRFGPYVQWGTPDAPPPGFDKPKMSSLFKTMALERITVEDAEALLSLPRTLGHDPADGEPILANNGRYGPYVQKGKDYRSIDSEDRLLTITLEEALDVLAQPKVFRRGGQNMAAKGPLRELGTDPVSGRPVVAKDGRFGVYVTDGETNASIGRGDRIEAMTPERAYELLAIRREQVAAKGGPAQGSGARKSAKKAPAKKRAAKKRT